MISRNSFGGAFLVKKLADAVEFLDNLRRPVTESERKAGPYPYYGANGLQGTIDHFIFDEPLVLLAEDGGHFDDPDRGIAYRVSGKTWVNNHAHVLRPKAGIDLNFLCRVLENYDVAPFVTGTTRGKLTKAGASEIPIPIPPLPEQRRIAAVLDQADSLRAKRREALAQLDSLIQSIFINMFGDPLANPKGWPTASVSQLLKDAEVFVDGDWVESKDQDPDGEVRLIQLADIGDGRFVNKSARFLTKKTSLRLKCTLLRQGDVLVARMPDPLGRACIFPGDIKECVTVVDVCIVRPSVRGPDPVWLMCCINTPGFRNQIAGEATGSTRTRISRGNLSKLNIIAPPHSLQKEFAERYQYALQLRQKSFSALNELDALFAAIQHRAFRGEL